jgi:hypothetical protein
VLALQAAWRTRVRRPFVPLVGFVSRFTGDGVGRRATLGPAAELQSAVPKEKDRLSSGRTSSLAFRSRPVRVTTKAELQRAPAGRLAMLPVPTTTRPSTPRAR